MDILKNLEAQSNFEENSLFIELFVRDKSNKKEKQRPKLFILRSWFIKNVFCFPISCGILVFLLAFLMAEEKLFLTNKNGRKSNGQ